MHTYTGPSRHFLLHASGTESFADYCRRRGIAFQHPAGAAIRPEDEERWAAALHRLPEDQRIAVEVELAKVTELSDPDGQLHLLAALEGHELPVDTIPGGTAVALWALLHHPAVFQEVFLHQEIRTIDAWRVARTKGGLSGAALRDKATALAATLQQCFIREGIARYCTVEVHRLSDGCCFLASVADRVQIFAGFTDRGDPTSQRLRPAFPVTFLYYPQDGTLLLKCRQRSEERILDLFQCFGRTVLGVEITKQNLGHRFDLDRLKREHYFLSDADDMTRVRVKALQLRYPLQQNRRQLKLETLAGDEPSAISELLRSHANGTTLDHLRVSYAELQVQFRTDGRSRSHIIRLWPNRSNLPQSPLGDRLRHCLVRWQLLHEHES